MQRPGCFCEHMHTSHNSFSSQLSTLEYVNKPNADPKRHPILNFCITGWNNLQETLASTTKNETFLKIFNATVSGTASSTFVNPISSEVQCLSARCAQLFWSSSGQTGVDFSCPKCCSWLQRTETHSKTTHTWWKIAKYLWYLLGWFPDMDLPLSHA